MDISLAIPPVINLHQKGGKAMKYAKFKHYKKTLTTKDKLIQLLMQQSDVDKLDYLYKIALLLF